MDSRLLRKQLEAALKEKKNIFDNYDKVKEAYEEEKKDVLKQVKKKYDPIFTKIEHDFMATKDKSTKIVDIFDEYAKFNVHVLEYILSFLLSYVEGEKFIPIYFKNDNSDSIIIKEDVYYSKLYKRNVQIGELDSYYVRGYMIYLCNKKEEVNYCDFNGKMVYFFGKFNYLKEFMNRFIQFRIENGLNDDKYIDYIDSFVVDFLLEHNDLRDKNREKRKEMLCRYKEYADDYEAMTSIDECINDGYSI